MKTWRTCIALTLFIAGFARGADHTLFTPDLKIPVNYREIVLNLKEGDSIRFSNGKVFTISKWLGCGGTTCVFAFEEDPSKAIRVTVDRGVSPFDGFLYSEFIDFFVLGDKALKKHGVPSVMIHDHNPAEYVVVDRIESKGTLKDFLEHPERFGQAREKMLSELTQFASKAHQFNRIGDFKGDQLHYTADRGWILVDWAENHVIGLSAQRELRGTFVPITFMDEAFSDFRNQGLNRTKEAWLEQVESAVSESVAKATHIPEGGKSSCPIIFRDLIPFK